MTDARAYITKLETKLMILSQPDLTIVSQGELFRRINAIPAVDVIDLPRWVSVTERLPDPGEPVLLNIRWDDDGGRMIAYGRRRERTGWQAWNAELGELLKGYAVTHWLPLPAPPEREEA